MNKIKAESSRKVSVASVRKIYSILKDKTFAKTNLIFLKSVISNFKSKG